MKFKTRMKMHSTPDFKANVSMEPIGFNTVVKGSFAGALGAIAATVDEVPIRLAIPFLRRKNKLQLIGTIGGFEFKLNPVTIKLDDANVQLDGIFGTKGIRGVMDTKVACETDARMDGSVSGRLGSFNVKLEEETFEEE